MNNNNQIENVALDEVTGQSYLDYSMSVITDRALADVRDGLKPVQRRVLYAMHELKNTPDKPHRKCARIVGDTMGKYHPHGDSSIYGALVYMAQDFNMGSVLIDGHGNFGSVDGDGAAAMRYTEARLSKLALEMTRDIDSDTVDFVPNFDDTEKEPVVLPARFPNLLVNGSQGIAVGMASNIPPHNLGETVDACICMIDNDIRGRETEIGELLEHVNGPDFPTGAKILGDSYKEIYQTGTGKVLMEAVYHFEKEGKRDVIVFTELPYHVNKTALVNDIAQLAKDRKLDISDVRDETGRDGTRVVVELKRSAVPQMILNELLKHTALRTTFSANMNCLVDGVPRVLNLYEFIRFYLDHQADVLTRRTRFELARSEKRAHIVEGLLVAIENIDEIIRIVRASDSPESAKTALMEAYGFSDAQAQTIIDMRIRALTGLEKQKLEDELAELRKKIAFYKKVLSDKKELLKLMKKELKQVRDRYAVARKTVHEAEFDEITMEDITPDEPCMIMRSNMGYIKRIKPEQFRAQKKGGKGSRGIQTIENDLIRDVIMTSAHADVIFFTSKGKAYSLKAYQIPEAGKNSRGTAIVSLINTASDEVITGMIAEKLADNTNSLFLVTKRGTVKKLALADIAKIKKNGIIVTKLKDDDELTGTTVVGEADDVMIVTRNGYCLCYATEQVRQMGRAATGVRGIKLTAGDEVVAVQKQMQGREVLLITDNGYAKRIACDDFPTYKTRGGRGVRCINASAEEKVGKVLKILLIEDAEKEYDIIETATDGTVIRFPLEKIPAYSRHAAGLRTMNLIGKDETLIADAVLAEKENMEDIPEEE